MTSLEQRMWCKNIPIHGQTSRPINELILNHKNNVIMKETLISKLCEHVVNNDQYERLG